MRKKYKYIFLVIIPVLFFISGNLLKESQGPYYLNFYDPSYVYLINSLNLAQLNGYGVGHYDHPGTTVQVIGAAVVYTYHLLSNDKEDITQDVLQRPEAYLKVINKTLGLLSTIMLCALGCFAFKVTGNLFYSLLIQFSPFTSMENFFGYIIVTPDNFLIFVSLLLIGVLIYYLYAADDLPESSYSLVLAFALVTALGMATKLNFFPIVLIPLLVIKGMKRKMIFIAVSVLLFHVLIFPVFENYTLFFEWISRLILYSGNYGQGEPTIVNSSEFFRHLGMIFTLDIFFTFTYSVMIITLVICLFKKEKIKNENNVLLKKQLKLLFIIFITITIQIIIVAKHYRQYYMIPSFMLSIFSLSLCAPVLAYHFRNLKVQYSYLIITILISGWALYQIILNYDLALFQRKEAFSVEKFIEDNYPDNFLISTYSTANKQTALAFAVGYAGSQKERYSSILLKNQKNHLFYNPWGNRFVSISDSDSDKEDIKSLLKKNRNFIVQIPENEMKDFIKTLESIFGTGSTSFSKVFTNANSEAVYEVKIAGK